MYQQSNNPRRSFSNNRRSSPSKPNFSSHRSSIRGEGRKNSYTGNSGGFSKPKFGYGKPRGFQRKTVSMPNDPALFIRKAGLSEQTQSVLTHKKFADFSLISPLQQNIVNQGFITPTPIQDQAIEPILEGRDVIGLASTGTGKTAAFLLPLIHKMFTTRNEKTLIIAPTRELAVQINEEFRKFAAGMKLYSTLIIGGASMNRQIFDIRRNPHVVIATPGRLKDLTERNLIHLDEYQNIVLDEVDLMVDIGFINDVKYFISLMPKVRQSLFFSATISPKIETILQSFVSNPVTISIKKASPSENVDQNVVHVSHPSKKIDLLHDLLIQEGFDKVIVFGRTKHGIEALHKELTFRGFQTGAIHGNKSQGQRQRTLQSFKRNEIRVLLATDVASRGLDIDNVSHVINYELPENFDDYIHRIGRTGRAGNTGVALTFIDSSSQNNPRYRA